MYKHVFAATGAVLSEPECGTTLRDWMEMHRAPLLLALMTSSFAFSAKIHELDRDRHVCRHVYTHVCRHVHGHVYTKIYELDKDRPTLVMPSFPTPERSWTNDMPWLDKNSIMEYDSNLVAHERVKSYCNSTEVIRAMRANEAEPILADTFGA